MNATTELTAQVTLLLFLVMLGSSCDGNRNRIVVPIRPCLGEGSEWARAPDPGPNRFPPPRGKAGISTAKERMRWTRKSETLSNALTSKFGYRESLFNLCHLAVTTFR